MKNSLTVILLLFGSLVYGQITLIPDSWFEAALIDRGIDSDGVVNGQVLTQDVETVVTLDIESENISDLTGIEDFAALEELNVNHNNLTWFDLNQNTQLRILYCTSNSLETLEVSNNILLEQLYCGNPNYDVGDHNRFTSLDLSNNLQLWLFNSTFAFDLESINFGQNTNLTTAFVYYCNLSEINFDGIPNVENLQLGAFDTDITGYSNNFTEVDFSLNPNLTFLSVTNMGIEKLNVQNGNNSILETLFAHVNPGLSCIQVDDEFAANNGSPPYDGWFVNSNVIYSENCLLGMEDFYNNSIVIYPNPSSSRIFIKSMADPVTKVDIFNLLGQRVEVFNQDLEWVDISNLTSGIYLMKIYTEIGTAVKKIIKQ